jgi:hypothetical protein
MKVLLSVLTAVLAISFCGSNSLAQTSQLPAEVSPVDQRRIYDPVNRMVEESNRNPERPAPEARVLKKGLLAPSAQARSDHAAFLKQSNTGLVKLLPRQRRDENLVKIRGGGAYYSFHYLSHKYGQGSDLELMRPLVIAPRSALHRVPDLFSVGFAGADYGMLTNLGDVPLEEITVSDSRAKFLAGYEPPLSDPDARCERRRFVIGETIDGSLYKNSLPVEAGATYLLRSISYGESDVLVGFRVVKREDDGSVTIAWKLLREFTPRELENVNVKGKCSGPIIIRSR